MKMRTQWNLAVPHITPDMIGTTPFSNKGSVSLFTAIIYIYWSLTKRYASMAEY